jgi:AcrR family transcriptional regulator
MPTRAQARKTEILDAALQVFSSKGFHEATNRDIAEAAGISSAGLIYHYFTDKRDLLMQLFERIHPMISLLSSPEHFRDVPLREGLLTFATAFVKLAQEPQRLDMMRLFLGEALRDPDFADILYAAGPGRGVAFLAAWLEPHICSGELREAPPELLARQFLGPVLLANLFRGVFRREEAFPEGLAEFSVNKFLEGARAVE